MSARDDAEILAAAREGFLAEARELMQAFESALLVMETDPRDAENLNAAFRAAHTIKGTAGLFGCDAVAAFTHEVETLMEGLRAGQLEVSADISAALLESLDQIGALLDEVNLAEGSPAVAARSAELAARLRVLAGATPPQATATASSAVDAAPAHDARSDSDTGAACWHLSLRFGADALRNGLDPLAFIRYLGSLGDLRAVRLLDGDVPALAALDAESCHLGFEIRFDSRAHPATDRAAIEQVFEFASEDAAVGILPPDANAADYEALLAERSGGDVERAAALRAVWQEIGVPAVAGDNAATTTAAQPMPSAAPPPLPPAAKLEPAPAPAPPQPAIDRRQHITTDRRENEPDRRDGVRDRRSGDDTRYVRVRADKLDRLIDTIGELVIAGSGAQSAALAATVPAVLEAAERVCDLVEEVRDGALSLRMVPVGETFARFHRVVRDVSKQLGKEVELVLTGGDTEMDKAMVDAIADPLTHLVRNSLDHGIELPAERLAAGKAAAGRLALHAYHEAGAIVIEVSDDGRGLARERILAKAVERGLLTAEAAAELDDAAVWDMIFAPGFSTAEQVTAVSGRGVGMDVVRRNVQALRGQISIASHAGRGTTMQLRLPLTLAIIDGFLTRVGDVHYVVPLEAVAECIDLPDECRAAASVAGTFHLRGEILPWLDLGRYYGHAAEGGQGDTNEGAQRTARRSLVLARAGQQRIGLVVDRLLGEQQTVIKPLASIFAPLKALAGSTILGSGEVALVLDMAGLVAAAVGLRRGAAVRATPVTLP
ncbi:MAG: chemotaxis protein CheA [Rubrivivax sp.]|nr:chemotaxis protein CheA [Rubrivivax sp.]MCL4695880.1 chemotaxis protein CheA [Burkholderiaceae bacterium]